MLFEIQVYSLAGLSWQDESLQHSSEGLWVLDDVCFCDAANEDQEHFLYWCIILLLTE